MLKNFDELVGLPAGLALPFFSEIDGADFPAIIGVADRALPMGNYDIAMLCSTALVGPGGPSVRVAAAFFEHVVPLFGGAAAPRAKPLCVVRMWLNPASEAHLAWVNSAVGRGKIAVEIITPVADGSAICGAHEAQLFPLVPKIARQLEEGFLKAMRYAASMPWASLDFPAACLAHEAEHPTREALGAFGA